ncbi:hypothetical protein MesoLj113b_68890 (plasmid) [Mesorhizobium sp. 113-3-3]|nr:hypothetical protein MesoLj113b_68890 [Mesorhizobium sp. 113-3-3]
MLLMDLQPSMPDVMGGATAALSPPVQLAARSAYPSVSLRALRSFAFAALYCELAGMTTEPKHVANFTRDTHMAIGTVKWFNSSKGFGFIQPDNGGQDVFVHISAVERAGLSTLTDGQKINYEIEQDRRTGKSSAGSLSKAG